MKLIAITGVDGAGKSTLAQAVAATLEREGRSSSRIYGRTYPFLSRVLMTAGRALFLRRHNIWTGYREYTQVTRRRLRSPILAAPFAASICFDYWVQIWLKLLPNLLTDRVIVADRYVYDTVIMDLAVHLSLSKRRTQWLIDLALRVVPRPDITLLLSIDAATAFSRKNDVPDVAYIRERSDLYNALESRPEVVRLEGDVPVDVLLENALTAIRARL